MLRFMRTRNRRTKTLWWALIIVTVVTFLGGFVFIVGSGLNSSFQARATGAVGTVNGKPISQIEYQNALAFQRESYRRQFGSEPTERDLKALEIQTWRRLVVERVLAQQARKLGIKAHDREVVVALQTSPPPEILVAPAFQTDGKFDPEKYQSFMLDSRYEADVARLEAVTRAQLPARKLQERLVTSIKLGEPELFEVFRSRFDRVSGTVVAIPAEAEAEPPTPSEAELDRAYEKFKSRFVAGPRTQVEVLLVPKQFGEDQIRAARELAQSLADRVRAGEDFQSLAQIYSTGPNADQGGVMDRVFQPTDFGPELGPQIAALDVGGVTDPIQDGSRFILLKLLERTPAPAGTPGVRLAQIALPIDAAPEQLREQYEFLLKLRSQAEKTGLGKAAAAKAMPTAVSGFYDANTTPPELFSMPEAAEWGLTAKVGAVSPVFQGTDEFAVVQVVSQSAGGPLPRDQVVDQLRQLAQRDLMVERRKPAADAVAQALARGRTLEQAAADAGLAATRTDAMTRNQPDPRYAGLPEVMGALFGARAGQVVGPIRTLYGWYFARPDLVAPADSALYEQVKEQLSNELLQSRQQTFLGAYMSRLRAGAKVQDLRNEPAY